MLVHCPRYLVVHLHVELVQVLRAELKQVLTQSCLLHIISLLVGQYWNSCICIYILYGPCTLLQSIRVRTMLIVSVRSAAFALLSENTDLEVSLIITNRGMEIGGWLVEVFPKIFDFVLYHQEILFHRQASSNEEYLEQKVSRGCYCPFCSLGGLHPGLININFNFNINIQIYRYIELLNSFQNFRSDQD